MPMFEFTCRGCGQTFETLVTGNRQAVCPRCHSSNLEKLYSTFAARGSSTRASTGGSTPRYT